MDKTTDYLITISYKKAVKCYERKKEKVKSL